MTGRGHVATIGAVFAVACGTSGGGSATAGTAPGGSGGSAGVIAGAANGGASGTAAGRGGTSAGGAAAASGSGGTVAGNAGDAGSAGDGFDAGSAGDAGATGSGGSSAGEAGADAGGAGGAASDGGEAGRPTPSDGGAAGGAGAPVASCEAGEALDYSGMQQPCPGEDTCEVDALGRAWSPPVRIDDGTGCVSGPLRVLQSREDLGFVAFADSDPARVRVRRVDGDSIWAQIEPAGGGWGSDLWAASDDGTNFILAGAVHERLFARASLAGGAWSSASTISNTVDETDPRTAVAVDSTGRGMAVWAEGASEFRYATWTAAGGWTAPQPFASSFYRAALAPIPAGGFALAFTNTLGVYLRFYLPGDAAWGTGEYVGSFDEAGAEAEATVSAAVDPNGTAHVAWTSPIANDSYANLFYDERNADGTWEITRGFDTEVDARAKPLLSISDEGDVILAWRRANTTLRTLAVSVRDERSWEEIRELDNFAAPVYPAVAMDATGNALIVWGREDTDFGLVRSNRYIAGSGWDASTYLILHDDPTATSAPHVAAAMSPTGEALVAYVVRKAGTPDTVFAHTLR